MQGFATQARRGERLCSERLELGAVPGRDVSAADRVEPRKARREITLGQVNPRELEIGAEGRLSRAEVDVQVAGKVQVRLGRGELTPLGLHRAAVAQQTRLPDRVALPAEGLERPVRAKARLRRSPG